MNRRRRCSRAPSLEPLEDRLCLASSVGWDGPGQGSAALTYYIGSAPASIGQAAVESAIQTALKVWSSVVAVSFTRTSAPNQLDSLDFTFRNLDGAGGALAQGYFPDDVNPARIAGDVQFDSSESWELGNTRGSAAFDLVLTAVHEIGHALGLEHSPVAGSIMCASVSPNQSFQALTSSDVTAIRGLYASAQGTTTATTTPSTPTNTTTATTRPTGFIPWTWNTWINRFRRFGRLAGGGSTAQTA